MDSNTRYGTDLIDPAFAGISLAEVCALASRLQTQVRHTEALNAKLTHEMAVLKRLRFAATSERFSVEQKSLLEEAIDEDLNALAREVEQLQSTAKKPANKHTPKRQPLPSELARRDVHHEPENTTCRSPGCGCQLKRIGEDISEKLDYLPGSFAVERHVRGKWACLKCQTLIQAPVPAAVIDKGIATPGLMAHVVVQIHRPPTAVLTGVHHGSLGCVSPPFYAGRVGGRHRRATGSTGPGHARGLAQQAGAACRRDTCGDAQARPWQDAPCLPLELLHHGLG